MGTMLFALTDRNMALSELERAMDLFQHSGEKTILSINGLENVVYEEPLTP